MENTINLHDLNKPLLASEIDFKPKQIREYKDSYYCTLLAYKDARVDMDILDEVCEPQNWQNEYKRDSKGVLQCGIGIFYNGQWIWKYSNGTPSDYESEKGEYSDAFKRAGFMWGIGRCLYEFPSIQVILNEKEYFLKDGKAKPSGYFKPNSWLWNVEWDSHTVKKVTAKQKFGNQHKERYNSSPYTK